MRDRLNTNRTTRTQFPGGRIIGYPPGPHPDADRIRLARIDLGDGEEHQVVFGGTRDIRPGDLVPAAPPGACVPTKTEDDKIRQRNWRGQSSYGMFCSSDELCWTVNGPDAVAVLQPWLQPGQSLDHITIDNSHQVIEGERAG
ncbi:hypothetical protein ABZV91_29425 [Nocardia sp. NPDC004568]|uniref:hypothetical protein n=1 Tax=Nocardia sp. NPDC004568 TaxID=3154551 RepID=UPI0033AF29B6